jgi:hypothetical protein
MATASEPMAEAPAMFDEPVEVVADPMAGQAEEPVVDPSAEPAFEPATEPTSSVDPSGEVSSADWVEQNAEAQIGSDGSLEVVIDSPKAAKPEANPETKAAGGLSSNAPANAPAPSAGLQSNAGATSQPMQFPSVSNMWRNFKGQQKSASVQPTNGTTGR